MLPGRALIVHSAAPCIACHKLISYRQGANNTSRSIGQLQKAIIGVFGPPSVVIAGMLSL
jgi:hypothetical protein